MRSISEIRNLEELFESIMVNEELPTNSRKVLMSNLRSFARVVGRPLVTIPLDVKEIRSLLATVSAAKAGYTKRSWSAIKSGVWRAVETSGIKVIRCTGQALSPELQGLLVEVPRARQLAMTPIVKFLCQKGMSPFEFDQAALDECSEWLESHYTKHSHATLLGQACRAWQKCQEDLPATWPQHKISHLSGKYYTFSWSEFPELEAETNLMIEDLRRNKRRRRDGRALLREQTLTDRKYHVLRAASALARQLGISPSVIRSLDQLTHPDAVELILDFFEERQGSDSTGNLYQLLRHINAVAKHWCKRCEEEMEELRNIRASTATRPGPAEKNIRLLSSFRDPKLRSDLVMLPSEIFAELASPTPLTEKSRRRGEAAFAIDFLLHAPLRISELLCLQDGITIHDTGRGSRRRVIVEIPPDKVKNEVARRFALGLHITKSLDVYRKHFRVRPSETDRGLLFCEEDGGPLEGWKLASRITKLLRDDLGIRMSPHQFRHVVGYIYLLQSPGQYETVRRLLGHRSIQTTMDYYAFALEQDSHDIWDQTLSNLRNSPDGGRLV